MRVALAILLLLAASTAQAQEKVYTVFICGLDGPDGTKNWCQHVGLPLYQDRQDCEKVIRNLDNSSIKSATTTLSYQCLGREASPWH